MHKGRWGTLLLIIAACSRPSLPPLPAVETKSFLPAVQKEIHSEFASVEQAPNEPNRNGRLGMLLHAHNLMEPALVCYRRAHLLAPEDARWSYLSGVLQASLSRNQEAAESFRAALRQKPDDVPARLGLADALLASGKYDESRTIYRKLTNERPALAAAWFGLGRTCASDGDLARAIESYQKACELYPQYGAARYALALAYRRLGNTADADRHLAAYEQDRNGVPPREDPLLAEVQSMNRGVLPLLARAKTAAAANRLQEALQLHQQALAIDPAQEQIHINLISLYARLGQFDKAEAHYRAGLERNPDRDELHYNYAVLLSATGRLPDAITAYGRALKLNPLHAEAHNNLAYLLARERKLDEALMHARKALESRPDYPQAHYNAATILVQRGEPQAAIRHLQAAIHPNDPNAPRYMEALAFAYQRAGDERKAREYAERARHAARTAP